jgi:predicted secreted protein
MVYIPLFGLFFSISLESIFNILTFLKKNQSNKYSFQIGILKTFLYLFSIQRLALHQIIIILFLLYFFIILILLFSILDDELQEFIIIKLASFL